MGYLKEHVFHYHENVNRKKLVMLLTRNHNQQPTTSAVPVFVLEGALTLVHSTNMLMELPFATVPGDRPVYFQDTIVMNVTIIRT